MGLTYVGLGVTEIDGNAVTVDVWRIEELDDMQCCTPLGTAREHVRIAAIPFRAHQMRE